jgi:hypothetical protein
MKTKDFLKKTEECNALINDMKNNLNKLIKEELSNVMKDFFQENPEVQCICWTQYTPHFNDGEPCEFGVHEPILIVEGFDADDLQVPYEYEGEGYSCVINDPGPYYLERAKAYEETKNKNDKHCYDFVQSYNNQRKGLAEACKEFSTFVSQNEDAFQNMFGDGVAVYLIPNKEPIVEDYDHD